MKYLWRRYWVRREQAESFNGYDLLPGPNGERADGPPTFQLSDLRRVPLLVLLGQPGMGKTTLLEEEVADLQGLGTPTDVVDLAGYDSGILLKQKLENSALLREWRDGGELHLFVDGLDRALVQVSVITSILAEELRASAQDMRRLRIRIACRSADWVPAIADRLSTLWPDAAPDGDPNVETLELLGLSLADVRAGAKARGLDPAQLLERITEVGAEGLAGIPITLTMILEAASEGGVLSTRTDLYAAAVRRLVTEHDPLTAAEREDALDADELLALAARQAASILLCDRVAVAGGDTILDHDVPLNEIAGGTEPLVSGSDGEVPAERQPMRLVHRSALMRLDGQQRATFVHHTYTEYLCALWLASGRLSLGQVEALIFNPHDPRRRLLAHLRDVAGWLAVLKPDVFGELIRTQAEVLLRGDLALLEPEARAALVRALLARVRDEPIDRWDPRVRANLGKLSYAGLAAELEGILDDEAEAEETRLLAVTLAASNRLTELTEPLLQVALDAAQPIYLRRAAADAIGGFGDAAARRRLLPLAVEEVPEDAEDDLKGTALQAIWPGLIDTRDLLASLTPPKRDNYFGPYKAFLLNANKDLVEDDLVEALEWAARLGAPSRRSDALQAFADAVVRRAWAAIERDKIADALASLFITRLKSHRALIGRSLYRSREAAILDSAAGRARIVGRLIDQIGDQGVHPRHLSFSQPPLLDSDDVRWLCERLLHESDERRRSTWADLIDAVFWPERSEVDVVLETAARVPVLADRLAFWLNNVEINSLEAEEHRKRYRQINATREEPEDEEEVNPVDMDAKILEDLAKGEEGDLDAWWQLNVSLLFGPDGEATETSELEPAITRMPGWQRAGEACRRRIVALAARYLAGRDAEPAQWLDRDVGWRPARAGYRAFILLAQEAPSLLEALEAKRWEAWAPAIIDFPVFSPRADADGEIVQRLARNAPESLVAWAGALIRAEDARGRHLVVPERLSAVASEPSLRKSLLALAEDSRITQRTRADLYEWLVGIDEPAAVDSAARTMLASVDDATRTDGDKSRGEGEQPPLSVALVTLLLRRAPAAAWTSIWEILTNRPDLGRRAVVEVAGFESFAAAVDLPEAAVADLYSWLAREFPRSADPVDNDGIVGTRQQVGWWRDRLLQGLVDRATLEAVTQIRRLVTEAPEPAILPRLARRAETAYAEAMWTAPQPRDLLRLSGAPERRLVQSISQLQSVVLESLRRADERLQGEWPKAWQLWNDKPLQPKNEERLSDWIKDWLDQDLARRLVTTREPQVRPTRTGAGIGARTDLHLDLPADGGGKALSLIIEVKRCWHRKVMTAMRSQLADDYLQSSGLSHGIYVVGFYDAPRWTGTGSTTARKKTVTEWRKALSERAVTVSRETGRNIEAVVLDVSLRSDRAS